MSIENGVGLVLAGAVIVFLLAAQLFPEGASANGKVGRTDRLTAEHGGRRLGTR